MQNKLIRSRALELMLATLALALLPNCVIAADSTFKDVVSKFASEQLTFVPHFIAAVCYVAGIGFVATGIFKLKEHADDPRSAKLSHVLIRLLVGVMLIGLPSVTGWVSSTVGITGSTAAQFSAFKVLSVN